ncbi:MAG TPA: transketolase family protein [archaeon]|nr:transketolase family protein [archaeon]
MNFLRENFNESQATRNSYGEALAELGGDEKIVVLDADLSCSTKTASFKKKFPDRFFNVGVAEMNLIGTSAGLSLEGKQVFASTFSAFLTGLPYNTIRQSICINEANVKLCGTHSGLGVGEDGPTHQMLEDISLMRGLPNMKVIVPADDEETKQVIKFLSKEKGAFYVRLTRQNVPKLFNDKYKFELGKAATLKEGNDLTLIGCGSLVAPCLEAAIELEKEGIHCRVINMSSIKPIDKEAIIKAAKETKALITAEDHQIIGGLGSAVAEVLAENHPKKLLRIGMNDRFGETGSNKDLYKKFGFTKEGVIEKVKEFYKNLNE